MNFDFLKKLIKPADTKIAMIVLDGLGGLPEEPGGQTELEAAHTPNLDVLAKEGMSGRGSCPEAVRHILLYSAMIL